MSDRNPLEWPAKGDVIHAIGCTVEVTRVYKTTVTYRLTFSHGGVIPGNISVKRWRVWCKSNNARVAPTSQSES